MDLERWITSISRYVRELPDVYRGFLVRVRFANGSEDALKGVLAADKFDTFLFDFFDFVHFPYRRTRSPKWLKPAYPARRKTRMRIVPHSAAARVVYHLPHLVSICDWNKHDDFIHTH